MAEGFDFRNGGPQSFVLDTPTAPTTAQGAPVAQGSAQLRGAVGAETPQASLINVQAANARSNETLDAIGKLADKLYAPQMEAAKQKAFWTGVQKAAAGQALTDIVKEQPWYARIFGDSDVVNGARAYEAQTRVTDVATQFNQDLPDLAKQDPTQVTNDIVNRLNGAMTGDPIADAVIQKAAVEAIPTFLKAHAKARYGYLQQEASRAEGASWQSSAALLQQTGQGLANGTASKEDYEAQTAKFLQSLAPAPGRDPTSYEKSLTTSIITMAQSGQFHAVNSLMKAGILGQLSNEQAQRVEREVDSAMQKQKAVQANKLFGDDLWRYNVMLRTNPLAPESIRTVGDALNKKFREATGIDEDMIDTVKSAETGALTLFQDQKSLQNKQDDALRKQMELDRKLAAAGVGFSAGQGKNAVNAVELNEVQASTVFRQQYADAADKNGFLIKNTMAPIPFIDPNISGQLQGMVKANQGQQYSKGFEEAYSQWKSLYSTPNGGAATAAAYFGEENKKMLAFDDRLRSGQIPEVAYHQVFVEGASHTPPLSKTDRSTLNDVVRDNWHSFAQAWFPGTLDNPSDATVNMISSLMADEYQSIRSYSPGRDPKFAMEQAAVNLKRRGLEVYGEYGWMPTEGSKPLTDIVGPNQKQLGFVMQDVINGKFKAMGVKNTDDHTVIRMPDRDGKAMLYVMALDNGTPYTASVTSDEIKKAYDKATANKVPKRGLTTQDYGPVVFNDFQ